MAGREKKMGKLYIKKFHDFCCSFNLNGVVKSMRIEEAERGRGGSCYTHGRDLEDSSPLECDAVSLDEKFCKESKNS